MFFFSLKYLFLPFRYSINKDFILCFILSFISGVILLVISLIFASFFFFSCVYYEGSVVLHNVRCGEIKKIVFQVGEERIAYFKNETLNTGIDKKYT